MRLACGVYLLLLFSGVNLFSCTQECTGVPSIPQAIRSGKHTEIAGLLLSLATHLQDPALQLRAEQLAHMFTGNVWLQADQQTIRPSVLAWMAELLQMVLLSAQVGKENSELGAFTTRSDIDELISIAFGIAADDEKSWEDVSKVANLLRGLPRKDDVSNVRPLPRRPGRDAVVTLVTGGVWVQGALVLGCSLPREVDRSYDLIAMCHGLNASELDAMRQVGWRCIEPEFISNPNSRSPWKWEYQAKIQPFNMTEFRRVLYLDSDIVVSNPQGIDDLFMLPDFPSNFMYAVRDCVAPLLRPSGLADGEMNGGVFVATPDRDMFESMVDAAPRVFTIDGGGQGFMTTFFRQHIMWLDEKYNYLRHTACVLGYELRSNSGPVMFPVSAPAATTLTGNARMQSKPSGGVSVRYIGLPGNSLTWGEIRAEAAGNYLVTFDYISGEVRNATLSVNGQVVIPTMKFLHTGSWETTRQRTVILRLEEGLNNVTVSNDHAVAPDFVSLGLYQQPVNYSVLPDISDADHPSWDLLVRKHLETGPILHFHFQPKPWDCREEDLRDCGRHLGQGSSNVKVMNQIWFEAHRTCAQQLSSDS